jgi:hypothetical protein
MFLQLRPTRLERRSKLGGKCGLTMRGFSWVNPYFLLLYSYSYLYLLISLQASLAAW